MTGLDSGLGFEKSNLNQSKLNQSAQLNQSATKLSQCQLDPNQLHSSQLNQPSSQFYTGHMTNPYNHEIKFKQSKSSSCTYVIVFLVVILMICAVLIGVYLTNRVDDFSEGSKTTKELGKMPNKLLNLGKSVIDEVSSKLDKENSTQIIQNGKINLNEVTNFASNLFKKINDTLNAKSN